MSVLIKGMEMPTNCLSCPLQGGTADCRLTQKTYNWGLTERPSDCPLIPVPEHGRLIDADALCELCDIMADKCDGIGASIWHQFKTTVEWSPIVIPAEESE